jgi:two-component system, chemotaxis family, response regulator WspR
VHALTAQLVDIDPESSAIVRDALADAGCIDIISVSSSGLGVDGDAPGHDLVIVGVHHGNVAALHRVVSTRREIPVIAICDEHDIDLAMVAGAVQCATRPLRRRELLGRIRDALRARGAERRRAHRERKMSDAIAALQREKHDLERLVCVDPLTGIANRRHAMDLLAAEWKRSAREHHPIALVMIDLDCFHNYNEQYGHLGGDACLQRVVDAMVRCLRRPSDFLGRYGGEEFMAVLPNTDAVGARIVAERMRAAVEALAIPHEASSCGRVVTVTVGFASIRVLADDVIDKLIGAADAALIRAKTLGRNRVGGEAPLVRPSRVSAQRWERYAPVYADPWFADRIPPFLEMVQCEVRGFLDTARDGERRSGATLQRIRGTAEEMGLVAVAMLLRDVEAALRDGENAALREATEELIQYVTHVQVVYRRTPEVAGDPSLARAG